MNKKHTLVIVDPQNDFCDHRGSLYVEGAFADIKRLAGHIEKNGKRYGDILISLDSHDVIAIYHPRFWTDDGANSPSPYTAITGEDFASGRWRPASDENQRYAEQTFAILREKEAGPLMVWPEHCVISTWGHQISDTLREALGGWRERTGKAVRYVFKGENPYTDQFSIFEGLDGSYPETSFNEALFARLAAADSVTFAGEALSHCVGESVLSYMRRLEGKKQEVILLTDCTSAVAGFDSKEMLERLALENVKLISAAEFQARA